MKKLIQRWLVLSTIPFGMSGCKSQGVVEVHRVPNSSAGGPSAAAGRAAVDTMPQESAGECPSGWSCMDLAALGLAATDAEGNPVTASCSMGGPMPCNDDDPSATCKGLTKPFCAHLSVGGQKFVSCSQRCSP